MITVKLKPHSFCSVCLCVKVWFLSTVVTEHKTNLNLWIEKQIGCLSAQKTARREKVLQFLLL